MMDSTKKMICTAAATLVLATALTLCWASSVLAHGDLTKHKKQVVVFVVDNISSDLLASVDVPNINALIGSGSYGLMNVRSAGTFTDGSGYLTLGTGTKAAAGPAGDQAYLGREYVSGKFGPRKASDLFKERTGLSTEQNQLVHIGIESVKRRSAMVPLNIVPGLLGETLKDEDLTIALVGNADSGSATHREASLIGIDQSGVIDTAYFPSVATGDLTLSADERFTDRLEAGTQILEPSLLAEYYPSVAAKNLLIIDTGATARVNARYAVTTPAKFARDREKALKAVDTAIGLFMDEIRKRDPDLKNHLIMVLSPDPARDKAAQKNYLTPIIVTGEGFTGGTLETDSTRRHGVITSMDFAPTVLKYFGIEPPVEIAGRPMRSAPEDDPQGLVAEIQNTAVKMYQTRNTVLGMITFANITVLVVLLVYLFIYRRTPTPFIRKYPYFIYFLLLVPLAFLFQLPVTIDNYTLAVSMSLAITLLLTVLLISLSRGSVQLAVTVACLFTVLAILVDIWSGGRLMLNSYFGSDLIAGGRFYGIGNTYMGILVGAALVGIAGLWQLLSIDKDRKLLIASGILLVVAVSIGHPRLGANVGGFITGVSALVFFILLFRFERIRLRHFVGLGLVILAALGALILVDLYLNPVQSHLARAVVSVQSQGLSEVLEIINRKINLNLRFFRSSFLSSILVLAIVLLIPLFSHPRGILRDVKELNQPLFKGLTAAAFTSLVALIFNDTGIVAAAAASQFIIFPVLLLIAQKINEDGSRQPDPRMPE